jgi:hypothetical protein
MIKIKNKYKNMVKPLQLVSDLDDIETLEVLEFDTEFIEVTEVLEIDTEVLEITEVLQVDTEVLKYVAIAVSSCGIWVQLSRPCSKKDANSFRGCQLRNETFKVVTETIFNKHLKKIT